MGEAFLAAPAERAPGLGGVAADVLAVLGPALGIRGHQRRLVGRRQRLESEHEELLGVTEVAHDLLGRPVLLVRTAAEHRLRTVGDGGVQLVSGASELLQHEGLRKAYLGR